MWYKLSDLAAELAAVPACLSNAIDIVHYLDAEHTAQFLPRWIRRSAVSRVRTIGTFHQPPELLGDLVGRAAARSLDLVLVVSPTQEAFFREFMPAECVRTVLYGVDTDFFRPAASRAARRSFRCITAGHWMRDWAAVRAVAESVAAEADIEFHVVTDRSTGLDDLPNIRRHANVDDESLRRLYQDADVLFLPLISATANNTLLEGLACGLPVVSTRLASVETYAGDGPAVLVERDDVSSLADAVLALRGDTERRVRMGRAARERAVSLSWPRVAAQLEDIYAALVGRG